MNRNLRNVFVMVFFALAGGWIGIWLNQVTGNTAPPMQSLGALVWLVSPALVGLLLRAFAKDGWRDTGLGLHLLGGWRWYLLALLVYPVCGLLTFGLGVLLGIVHPVGFGTSGWGEYLAIAASILGGSLVKNIFEEFAWRSYLTPRLQAAKIHPLLNHLIVSLVWMSWHLPYYYYFLGRDVLARSITTSIPVFLLTGYLVMFFTSVLFGELRLLSRTVWTVFLLHNVINALSMPLIANGFIKVDAPLGFVFTPTNEGLITAFLFGVVGWVLYQYRMKNSQPG